MILDLEGRAQDRAALDNLSLAAFPVFPGPCSCLPLRKNCFLALLGLLLKKKRGFYFFSVSARTGLINFLQFYDKYLELRSTRRVDAPRLLQEGLFQ